MWPFRTFRTFSIEPHPSWRAGEEQVQVQYLLRTNGLVSVDWLSTQGVRKPLNVSMHACETGVVISSSAQPKPFSAFPREEVDG
jgi:hypothetical protein